MFVAQTQSNFWQWTTFHTALRLLYFFRNSDPNADIYLPNLFQWEECNPFFLVHWDKKIKLARNKLYKNNSSVLEGFIIKGKWKKKPNQTKNHTKKLQPKLKETSRKPLFQKKKSWQQPVRNVMVPYKSANPHTPKAHSLPFSLHWAPRSPIIFFPSQWAEEDQVSCLLVQNWIAFYYRIVSQWNQRQLSLHIFHSSFSGEGRYLTYWVSCTHLCHVAI